MTEKLYSVAEAAARLGVSVATVRRMCAAGKLSAQHVGKQWIISMEPQSDILNPDSQ